MKLREYVQTVMKAAELAKIAGVAPSGLSYFLNGKRGFRPETMAKIIKATNGMVTFDDLVAEMGEHRRSLDKVITDVKKTHA